jgi:hypothetical protein
MNKQVNRSHYEFTNYLTKERWASIWHQLDLVLGLNPDRVLEIGPGPGVFKATAKSLGINVETLDIDPDLNPDHVASVFDMPFQNGAFDAVCAFQVLEHLPYEKSIKAFLEMARVAQKNIVLSLPDAKKRWPMSLYVPKYGIVRFSISRPRIRTEAHDFKGEHYWEINKQGYPLGKIKKDFAVDGWVLEETFQVHENSYHRFFVFSAAR